MREGGVFINYRRGCHNLIVAALHDALAWHFGAELVFLDRHSIPMGSRYPETILDKVAACGVLVAVIHRTWTEDLRRPRDGKDWVCEEIAMALRAEKQVFPVLLDDANPPGHGNTPGRDKLPADLKDLANRNAYPIRWATYRYDLYRLIASLEPHVARSWWPPEDPTETSSRWTKRLTRIVPVAAAIAAMVGLLLPVVLGHGLAEAPVTEIPTWALYGALAAMLASMVLLLAVGFVAMVRGPASQVDRELHAQSAARYRLFSIPAGFGTLLVLLILVAAPITQTDTGRVVAVIVLVPVFVIVLVLSGLAISRADARDDEWPPSRPPTTVASDIRRVAVKLRKHLEDSPPPLSRMRREQVSWLLDELRERVVDVREEARRGRLAWLFEDHPLVAVGVAAVLAGGVGCAFVGVQFPIADATGFKPYLPALVLAVLIVVPVLTALRLAHWDQRRVRESLASEIEKKLLPGLDAEFEARMQPVPPPDIFPR